MDLSTSFMGLQIETPLVLGASPLSSNPDRCRELEDQGLGALVMESLFMEQIEAEHRARFGHPGPGEDRDPKRGPTAYLEQVRRLAEALDIPVIASLNGTASGAWARYARLIEQAGADGLELNVYYLPLDDTEPPAEVEQRHLSVLTQVKESVAIPVAMKLTQFFSSPAHLGRRLQRAGADGLVLFAPLFHTDLDLDSYTVVPALHGSDPGDLGSRLLWLAAMYGRVKCPLALSGGAHTHLDLIKGVMSGASAVQMTTALLRHGPGHVATVLGGLRTWLEGRELESIQQLHGAMSLLQCADPQAFERANYMKALQTWKL